MFEEDEEEEEPIEAYYEAFCVLYVYCLMYNLLNRIFLDSTINRYRVSVGNLRRCTIHEDLLYNINRICEQFVAIDRHILRT